MKVVMPVKDSTDHTITTVSPAARQRVGRKESIREMVFRGQRTMMRPTP